MEENSGAAMVYGQDQLNRLHLNDIFNIVAYSVMSLGKIFIFYILYFGAFIHK